MASLKSLATVSGFTAVSRLLGFARDYLVGRYVDNSIKDAFFTAFTLPNMGRRVLGEGAFNSAFVPLFAKKLEGEGKEKALNFGNQAFSVLAAILAILTGLVLLATPLAVSVLAQGFKARFSATTATGQAKVEIRDFDVKGEKEIFLSIAKTGGAGGVSHLIWGDPTLSDRDGKTTRLPELVTQPETGRVTRILDGKEAPLTVAKALPPGQRAAPEAPPPQAKAHDEFRVESPSLFSVKLPKGHKFEKLQATLRSADGAALPAGLDVKLYKNHPNTFPLAVSLTRITIIYLLCMALAAQLGGVLNTVRVFGIPAAAPALLNVVLLLGIAIGFPLGFHHGYVLAWCVLIAGFAQLFPVWWACHSLGYPIHLVRPRWTEDIKRLFILMGPGVIAAGIQQINLTVGRFVASFQQNAVTYLYLSDRVNQLPLGLVGIAFATVLLPDIARKVRAGAEDEARASLNRGIEYSLLISLPAAVGIVTLAFPIVSALFEGSKFSREDCDATSLALLAFAIGLPGYVLIRVLQPAYFAREDTKNPMLIAGVTVVVNIVASVLLFFAFKRWGVGHMGIALATSLAAWVNVYLLWHGLRKTGRMKPDARLKSRLGRTAAASLIMGISLVACVWAMHGWARETGTRRFMGLAIFLAVGGLSFASSAASLGAINLGLIWRRLRPRRATS